MPKQETQLLVGAVLLGAIYSELVVTAALAVAAAGLLVAAGEKTVSGARRFKGWRQRRVTEHNALVAAAADHGIVLAE